MMSSYRKFMVLSSPRCGTHMLRSSLNAHPNGVCLTEMFNPDYTVDRYAYTENTPEAVILQQFIFPAQEPPVQAVGFCLHRLGARFGNWPRLWEMLEADPALHVISLRRDNLLRRYFSFQLRTIQDLRNGSIPAISIDRDKLEADFRCQSEKIAEFDRRFAQHPLLIVTYEQLCQQHVQTMQEIQQFLGLPYHAVAPTTAQRATPPLEAGIKNYSELKAAFAATPWARYFD